MVYKQFDQFIDGTKHKFLWGVKMWRTSRVPAWPVSSTRQDKCRGD